MLQSVSYLNIKPFAELSSSEQRKTTITVTSFEDVLEKEQAVNDDNKATEPEVENATAENSESKIYLYKEPITGRVVVYEDVAKTDNTEKTTSSQKAVETVDSMKKTKYDTYFKEAAKKYNVSESLLKAIAKAESNFNPNDVSSSGAMGIMQLMPETAKSLGVKDAFDPEQNIMGGAKCISQKLKEFNGDVSLALAAYNAGSGAVKRNGGVPSYCKSYVSKVLSYKSAFETAVAVG